MPALKPSSASETSTACAMPKHPPTTVERGLIALALCEGNAAKASRELAQQGLKLDKTTLSTWRRERKDEWLKARERVWPWVKAHAEDMHAELATQAGEIERLANEEWLRRLREDPAEIADKDLQGIGRNAATQSGIHTDKVIGLRGDPTEVVHRTENVAEILRALKARGVVIEGSAEEVSAIESSGQP